MENQQFRRYSHKVGMNFWHLEWCTKYRYNMMRKLENKNLVQATIRKAAFEHKIKIKELSIMPDHIHMLVTLPHDMTDSKALQLLKGRSSYLIFRNKKKFSFRYPKRHFWACGGFASTVGYTDLETTNRYIQNQEKHHEVVFS